MEEYIGYIKYKGDSVSDGMMDARRSAEALLGFDSAMRHFVVQQYSDLKGIDFEMPIRIRKGSWEALIPETIGGMVQASMALAGTAYATKAIQTAAANDFENIGLKDIFKKSLEAMKWMVKIGKHLGTLTTKEFKNVRFSDNNGLIGIPNGEGEVLYVPKEYLDLYVTCSPKILEGVASVVDSDKTLFIGTIENGEVDEVVIGNSEKNIFCKPNDDSDDILFPELVHGANVILDGEVTRENKTSNSMGFKYLGHILTSHPESGSIVRFKPLLFLNCRLHGVVSRMDENGRVESKRPKLLFSHLEPLDQDVSGGDLFEELIG